MAKKGNKKKTGKKVEQKLIDDAFREKLAGILAQTAEEKATETKDSPLGAAYRRRSGIDAWSYDSSGQHHWQLNC